MDIKGSGKTVAPTPQNTPASAAPAAYSRPQVPPTLAEDDEPIEVISSGGRGAPAGLTREEIASNPAFINMVQGKLANLVNRSSGYVESLPLPVRERVDALKGVQVEQQAIEAEYQHAILELERKFAEKFAPVYDRRARIVAGEEQPAEDLIDLGRRQDEEDDSEDEDEEPTKVDTQHSTEAEREKAPKGIPGFWLTALNNHIGLSELITERDEGALKHLTDVRVAYLDAKPGFKIVFTFGPGAEEFFANKSLEKTYYYQDEVGYEGDFVYDHAEGTKIEWKEGRNLTVKVETKKQRNKNTKETRTVKKEIPTDSFFTFFSPPSPPSDDVDEDEEEELESALEMDYQIGEDLKDRVIPRAVDYFTGKALRYADDMGSEDFEDGDLDDDDDEDDEDDDLPPRREALRPPPMGASGVTPASSTDPQECKQQ